MGGFIARNKGDLFQPVVPYNNESLIARNRKLHLSLGRDPVLPDEPFNFNYTEGQSRRHLMATCDPECSQIIDFLFVGGAKVDH
jgi:hypothetical protein